MIVDLTLTIFERKVREKERWNELIYRPCPDLHFIPNLVDILAATDNGYDKLVADFGGFVITGN